MNTGESCEGGSCLFRLVSRVNNSGYNPQKIAKESQEMWKGLHQRHLDQAKEREENKQQIEALQKEGWDIINAALNKVPNETAKRKIKETWEHVANLLGRPFHQDSYRIGEITKGIRVLLQDPVCIKNPACIKLQKWQVKLTNSFPELALAA